MRRSIFKSKIHRATVTDADLDYEGSVTIDQDLLDAADMWPWEEVHVWNLDNGARLTSYILPGERGSGTVCMNGAAAHRAQPGHKVILATFAQMEEQEARVFKPRVVLVDANNRIVKASHQEKPLRALKIS
jgi:aspartate 1-decarboxylase